MHLAKKLAVSLLALSLTALLPSCDSGITAPGVNQLGGEGSRAAAVRLEFAELDLAAGDTARLAAEVVSAGGVAVPGFAVSWSSSAPEVVSVSREGTLRAHRDGEAAVTATAGRARATARVRVSGRLVARLLVSPEEDTLHVVGETVVLNATAVDPSGAAVVLPAISWASLDLGVAVVDGDGRVTSVGPGMARITAGGGGRTDTVRVHVKQNFTSVRVRPRDSVLGALGDTLRITADAQDVAGDAVPATSLKWTSLNPAVATVDAAGLVTARANGVTRVAAEYAGRADTARVEVKQLVASIAVTPGAPTVQAGQTQGMVAAAKDANGNDVPGVTFAWMSSNTAAATVDAAGSVRAVAPGVSYVTAAAGSRTGTATVTVTANPGTVPARVAVEPEAATLDAVGAAAQLGAAVYSAAGTPMAGVAVSWSSLDAGVATVDGVGRVTARAVGTARVVATAGTLVDTAAVTVRQLVAAVAVSPSSPTVQAGGTQQMTASASDANGNPVPGAAFAWTSSNTQVATVDAAGVVRAAAAGVSYVTATSGGRTATATLTVTAAPVVQAPVASVSVSPATASLTVGGSAGLDAVARDAAGAVLTGRVVTWTSSNPAVAAVSASGAVTAVAAGSATVTATVEGKTGTAAVAVTAAVVTPAPVATVSVTPGSAALVVGGGALLSASARDAAGNALTGRAVAWSTSNAAVATVSASGMVTGVAAGSATITATVEGKTGTASVTVSADPATTATRISVSPRADTLGAIGAATQLRATVLSAAGSAITDAAVSWSSLSAGVAAVDASGRVTARAAGTARIVAASGPLADTATVVVRQVVASVAVSPSAPVVQEGATQQVSATARDANGNDIAGAAFTWTSSNTAAATVNGSGLVSGVAAGVSYVTASAGGKNAVATVTVAGLPVATVAVTPASASIAAGATVDLAAVARDASGRILTGRAVTWATSNPAVATVSGTGLVTGVTGGVATITATSEGKSGTAAVTVSAPVAGAALAFQDGFESGGLATVVNNYRWGGAGTQVTREIVRSGAYSMKFNYAGSADLCADAWSEQRFQFGENLPEVWLEYYIYLPRGTEGTAKFTHRKPTCSREEDPNGTISNNKFLALWDTAYSIDRGGSVRALLEYRRTNSAADGDSYMYGMWGTDTRTAGDYGQAGSSWDPAFTDAMRGRWVQVRVHAKVADSKAAANGMIQLWVDGALKINMQNLDLAPNAGGARWFRNGYLMGWANSGFDQNTAVYIDDFKIFRSGPGW